MHNDFHTLYIITCIKLTTFFVFELLDSGCFTDKNGQLSMLDWLDINRKSLVINQGVTRYYLEIDDVMRHKDYNHATGENDVALVFLGNAISAQDTIQMPSKKKKSDALDAGDEFIGMGWGLRDVGMYLKTPENAREVEFTYTGEKCSDPSVVIVPTSDNLPNMCASADEETGTCAGDEGGPLVMPTKHGDVLVGILSKTSCGIHYGPTCPAGMHVLKISMKTGTFPASSSWTLMNLCSGVYYGTLEAGDATESDQLYSRDYCIGDDAFDLRLSDSFCSNNAMSDVEVHMDDELIWTHGGNIGCNEVFTWGDSESCSYEPSIYTSISSTSDWIDDAIECRSNPPKVKTGGTEGSGRSKGGARN